MRLDPYHPVQYLSWLGHSYFRVGQYERAIEVLNKGVRREPNYIALHVFLAASYAVTGREEEANAEAAEVLRLNPRFTLGAYEAYAPTKNRPDLERDLIALRKAGLPD